MTQVLESLGSRYRKSKRTQEADEVLTPDDAVDVMEELLPAQNRSYELGLKLKLLQSEVESIHSTYSKPRSCLLHILIEFTNQTEPKPTWRVIVVALRSPAVNLPALARKMEAAHLSDDDLPPPLHQTPLRSLVHTKAPNDDVVSKASSDSVEGVEAQIERFHQRFNSLKELTIRALNKCCVAVMTVVYILTSIRTVQEHRVFLKENHKALRQCEDHLELFGSLNFYWNYLTPDLLDHLITELAKKHEPFQTVAKEITSYKKDLQDFRKRTTLALFCEAEPNTPEDDPPPGFRKMVVRFDWPPTRTLEDVEMFRRRYAWSYDLQTCAMMLNSIGTGTFIVTLFVPVSVVELLRRKRALNLFKEFNITQIDVHTSTTICIYQKYFETQMDHFSSNSGSADTGGGSADTGGVERVQKKGENYPFVEQPSKNV